MLPHSAAPQLGPYDDLSREGKTLVEYVWIASSGCSQLRSKTRVLDHHPTCVEEVPMLVVEGSADSAAFQENELCLKPRKVFPDPFRGNGHLLVLCDSFVAQAPPPSEQMCLPLPTLRPHPSNARVQCQDVMSHSAPNMIAFAFQQEYRVLDSNNAAAAAPHGCGLENGMAGVHHAFPLEDGGSNYAPNSIKQRTAVGTPAHSSLPSSAHLIAPSNTEAVAEPAQQHKPLSLAARKLAEHHLMICLRAGINISEISQRASSCGATDAPPGSFGADGTAATPDVWTYKLGPTLGIDTADQLWMSRFLMMRVSELDGLRVSFDPHASGDPSGMHCRTECSTEATRCPTHGLAELERHVALLHVAQLQFGPPQYSPQRPRTSFNSGGCGLRVGVGKSANAALPLDVIIPTTTLLQGCGHWIDCRPASNADPYLVISSLAATVHRGTVGVPVPQHQSHQQHRHPYLPMSSPKSILAHTLGSSASHASACLLHSHSHSLGGAGGADDMSSSRSLGEDDGMSDDDDDMMSDINSEDVLIDELDRIDAGREEEEEEDGAGNSFKAPGQQRRQRRRRCAKEEEDEECCSSGSSPVLPTRRAQQCV